MNVTVDIGNALERAYYGRSHSDHAPAFRMCGIHYARGFGRHAIPLRVWLLIGVEARYASV